MRTKNKANFRLLESFIDGYQEKHGISPTTKDISRGTGLSTGTISRYPQYMREQGMIDYQGHKGFVTRKMRKMRDATELVPRLVSIACGIPKFAEGNIEEYVRLPIALLGSGDFFLSGKQGTIRGIFHSQQMVFCLPDFLCKKFCRPLRNH